MKATQKDGKLYFKKKVQTDAENPVEEKAKTEESDPKDMKGSMDHVQATCKNCGAKVCPDCGKANCQC